VLLRDGTVLIAGGMAADLEATTSAELFKPWSAGSASARRSTHLTQEPAWSARSGTGRKRVRLCELRLGRVPRRTQRMGRHPMGPLIDMDG
jgi:hypothetical protein